MRGPSQEWITVRCYDPAINDDDVLDDAGEKIERVDPKTGELEVDGNGDPQYEKASDIAGFIQSRDMEKHLVFYEGCQPLRFQLRPLKRSQMRDYILATTELDERYDRAFECALLKITGIVLPNGEQLTDWIPKREEKGTRRIKAASLDELWDFGLTDVDFREIGAAAFWRARIPFGCDPYWQVPQSSLVGLVTKNRVSRSAGRSPATSASTDNGAVPKVGAAPSTTGSAPSTDAPGDAPAKAGTSPS